MNETKLVLSVGFWLVGVGIAGGTLALVCAGSPKAQAAESTQQARRFAVGDKIEIFSAGDALHGIVIGPRTDSGVGYAQYAIRLNDGYEQNYKEDFVRPRFQPDSNKRFVVGAKVEARRWDGKAYKGTVIGVDGQKYSVRHMRDGAENTEWFHAYNLRDVKTSAAKKPGGVQPAAPARPGQKKSGATARANVPAGWPGQKFRVGDRVRYGGVGFASAPTYGVVIAVDAKKRLYQVRDEKDASLRYSYAPYDVFDPRQKISNSFYVGKWQVYTPGALTSRLLTGSLKLAPLEILGNGTYIWRQSGKKAIHGRWTPRSGVPGIVLLKGEGGTNWTLYEKTEAFATTRATRDEIGLRAGDGRAGYLGLRIGPNQSEVLRGRF